MKKTSLLKEAMNYSALQIATKICMQQKLLAFFMTTYNLAYFFPIAQFFFYILPIMEENYVIKKWDVYFIGPPLNNF
mgnify:CR=1 FL=1